MKGGAVRYWRLDDVLGGVPLLRADIRRTHFPKHFHDDYTFGLITRGANRFVYRGERVVAPAGAICLADPGEVHTGEADEGGWSYWTIHVAPTALAALRAELDDANPAPPDFLTGVVADVEAARAFAGFFRSAREPGLERQSRAVVALAGLIRRHSAAQPKPTAGGDEARIARRARDLLADRLAEPVSLAQLAEETGAGRYRLIRAFRRTFGLPPHAWQIQKRIARAHAAIAAGVPIAQAAVEAGFSDQAHLTRVFRRYLGYTPGLVARAA